MYYQFYFTKNSQIFQIHNNTLKYDQSLFYNKYIDLHENILLRNKSLYEHLYFIYFKLVC